jgi:hypothetical protein
MQDNAQLNPATLPQAANYIPTMPDYLSHFLEWRHLPVCILGMPQIPVTLQVQPELGARLERFTKCQRRIRTDLTTAVYHLVEACIGPAEVRSKCLLGQTQWLQKLLQQHFARVCGGAFLR